MAQNSTLTLDSYERRLYTTIDPIDTVMGDAYFNPFKRELEPEEIIIVKTGGVRYRIRVVQVDPYVTTTYDSIELKTLSQEVQNLLGNPVTPPNSGDFTVALVSDNNTAVTVSATLSGGPYIAYAHAWDTDITPSDTNKTPLNFSSTLIFLDDLGDYTQHVKYLHVQDESGTWTQLTPSSNDDGNNGFIITANAVAPPAQITDLAISNITPTTVDYTFSATTIVDGVTLRYDIINNATGAILAGDVSTSGTVTGLYPVTAINYAVKVYPANDITRVSVSNIEAATTLAVGTLTVAIADDNANLSPTITTVDTSSITLNGVTLDQWLPRADGDTSVADPNDSGWTSFPTQGVSTLTFADYGTKNWTYYARQQSLPTSISVIGTDTVVLTNTGTGVPVFGWEAPTVSISEEGQVELTINVNRINDTTVEDTVDYATADGTGIAQTNYKTASGTLTFAISDTQETVTVPILFTNLGHINGTPNTKTFTVTLSNASRGSIDTALTTITVTIQGINKDGIGGYRKNGQIDTNYPPVDLTKITGPITYPTSQTGTISLTEYVGGTGARAVVQLESGINTLTFIDCVFSTSDLHLILALGNLYNIKIVNCVFKNWWSRLGLGPNNIQPADLWGGFAISCDLGGFTVEDIDILGCKAEGAGSFAWFNWSGGARRRVNWNYFKDLTAFNPNYDPEADFNPQTSDPTGPVGGGRLLMLGWNPDGQHDCRGNVCWWPAGPYGKGDVIDMIDYWQTQVNQEANRSYCERNFLVGSTSQIGGQQSSTGLISEFDDPVTGSDSGYLTWRYNQVTETNNAGINVLGGVELLVRDNDIYCPDEVGRTHRNGVGLGYELQTPYAGVTHNNVVKNNNILWYQYDPVQITNSLSNTWSPSLGSDLPANWSNQNIMDGTSGNPNWGGGSGDTLVLGRHPLINNPGWEHGIDCKFSHYNCTSGNGVLSWDDTAKTLAFTAYGDSAGSAQTISMTPSGDSGDWDAEYDIPSGTNDGIRVLIDPTTLNAVGANKDYIVRCTAANITAYHVAPYNQDISITTAGRFAGEWAGTETTTISGTAPAVPTGVTAASASATSISVDSSDYPISGAGSYYIYRDTVLIATPTVLPYVDTGLTTGQSYSYRIASASTDTPPIVSAKSLSASATPTDTSNLVTDGDMTAMTGWTENLVTKSTSGGVGRGTLTTTAQGCLYQNITGLTASTTYNISWEHLGDWETPSTGYRDGSIAVDSDTTGFATTGDLFDSVVGDSILTSGSGTFTTNASGPGSTSVRLMLWTTDSTIGAFTEWDNVSVTP